MASVSGTFFVNPIPSALAHYQRESEETWNRIGQDISVVDDYVSVEGRSGATGKAQALLGAVASPFRLRRRTDGLILVAWPSLGLLEPHLWHSSSQATAIIVHDPVPLRRQYGFGRLPEFLARHPRRGAPALIAHSPDAERELVRLFPAHTVLGVLHPILTSQVPINEDSETVLVAGQYKPARDLELLAKLGPRLRRLGFRPRIVGRGWPDSLDGWEVESRFLSEPELDAELAGASTMLLPYRHYFQSGIAIRALEQGTLTVGSRTSFIESLFGADSPSIVHNASDVENWVRAIQDTHTRPAAAREAHARYVGLCDESWTAFLGEPRAQQWQ